MIWFIIKIIIDVIGNIIVFASIAFLIGKAAWQWQKSDSFIEDRKKAKKEIDKWTEPVVKILLLIWATRLRIIYVIFASVILYYLFELFLKLRFQLFVDITNLEDNDVRNLALAFLGTISGIGALFGVYLAILRSETNERQTYTAEQGLITDRINKATEGLGKKDGKEPVIEVRLGALYALERIAQDSIRDHIQIIEILCAYIRHNRPLDAKSKDITEDIQAALTIIGRRMHGLNGKERMKTEIFRDYYIDLSHCDLRGANLTDANFFNTRFFDSDMTDAIFMRADLTEAVFFDTNLTDAGFDDAILTNAHFDNTTTALALAFKCDFSKCYGLTQKNFDQMFCGINVIIPDDIIRPDHWPQKGDCDDFFSFVEVYKIWRKKNKSLLTKKTKK